MNRTKRTNPMSTSTHTRSRRRFLQTAAASTFAFQVVPRSVFGANSRVQLAGIGAGGKGAGDIADNERAGAVVVALCDVDRNTLKNSGKKYGATELFTDFRELIENLGDKVDAVTVSTADHTHFHAAHRGRFGRQWLVVATRSSGGRASRTPVPAVIAMRTCRCYT